MKTSHGRNQPSTVFFFFFLGVFSSIDGSAAASRSRFDLFMRAPSITAVFLDLEESSSFGSSTPDGFKNVSGVTVTFAGVGCGFIDDGPRRSTPTPPVSKMACFAVLPVFCSFSCSKPRNRPELPDADIEMGRG
jgi:hypothetical protein